MAAVSSYDVSFCKTLKEKFLNQKLFRPFRGGRYDAGTRLNYDITGVSKPLKANVDLEIEKFVGGGFAGQVYRVKILNIQAIDHGALDVIPLETGRMYAMKILIPPSGFSLLFRNIMYRIGFQSPFQLQSNPTAVRAGALWQKFIRRGAKVVLGDERAVNDVHATMIDSTLGSCGEISDWVDGRTWRLEVDDRMDLLNLSNQNKKIDPELLGSPEYRAKKQFMADFVALLHSMGAHEFARQYEWSTCKSQPNSLKRTDTDNDPTKGLMAVDFRAGLALLPLLPMSPGDVKLIFKGLARGSLVQFDRGNLKKLEKFILQYKNEFQDMLPMLDDLKSCEDVYRNSVIDITHNHFKLLFSRKLWSTILESARIGWRIKNTIHDKTLESLRKSTFKTLIFYILGAIPFLGSFLRKIWGRPDLRKHYGSLLTSWNYIRRSGKARCAEYSYHWYRNGRVSQAKAEKISNSVPLFFLHLPLSFLPIGIHRSFTDKAYFKERIHNICVKPIQLYFSASMREQWLRDMIAQGQSKRILNEKETETIYSQLKEPYIQKYLKSLAVHVLLMPTTHIVSILFSWYYITTHPGLTKAEIGLTLAAIQVLFQITPISPGSLARGIYVLYLIAKERNFKDYNIAVFLSFFKYIGYLAFPIQMTYRYPELARFMAGHWATEAVHIVPVFGEHGALLEHWIFRLFYNWPLTVRRRMRKWAEIRATQKKRYWHIPLYTIAAVGILTALDYGYFAYKHIMPGFDDNWWFGVIIILAGSVGITLGCGGASLSKRIISASIWGMLTGAFYPIASVLLVRNGIIMLNDLLLAEAWYIFAFTVFASIGAIVTELRHADPDVKKLIRNNLPTGTSLTTGDAFEA